MKRYLLFAGDQYYPSGGWNDFKNSFHSLKEATEAANKRGGERKERRIYERSIEVRLLNGNG